MNDLIKVVLPALIAGLCGSGVSSIILYKMQKKDASHDLLLGLGHDRIIHLCEQYIEQGYITTGQYDNLYKYLYLPYKARGGNGTAEKMIQEVQRLPMKPDDNTTRGNKNVD